MSRQAQLVECLACGERRTLARTFSRIGESECPRCGYIGWAPASQLTEPDRRALRDRPLESRRLRPVT